MKVKKIIIGIICGCLFICYSLRLIQVNEEFPDTEITTCQKGNAIDFEGIRYRIASVDWKDKEETDKHAYDSDRINEFGNYKTVIVELEATNISDRVMTVEAYEFCIEGNGFTNGVNATYIFDDEKDNIRMVQMSPGETGRFKLPYFCAQAMVSSDVWEDIESREFKLIVSLYPQKIELIL